MSSPPSFVVTATPHRVSLLGGGSDLPDFFLANRGAVVSLTIKRFLYVTVKRHSDLFGEQYRLSYSETEHADSVDDIRNDIARECLKLVPVPPPLYISTASDVPASSGLGSSAAFAIGLLHALHALRGEDVSPLELADEASTVEIDRLNRPIGLQDQYACAYGGLNYLQFEKGYGVRLEPLLMSGERLGDFLSGVKLVWSGNQRDAGEVLGEQRRRIPQTSASLIQLVRLADDARTSLLSSPDPLSDISKLVNESWELKRGLATGIDTAGISRLISDVRSAGASAAKVCGAGGGGFVMALVPPEEREPFASRLADHSVLGVELEPRGSRLVVSL